MGAARRHRHLQLPPEQEHDHRSRAARWCCNDAREARRVEQLRFHGIARLPDGTRDVELAGGKYNFSDVSARIGLEQLAHLDDWFRARERLAR